uniref:Uncharacterized protein n=1 Tax=Odontella aurita TaxID=265563 RepID=A0A7S4K1T3_9STRA|mmetsp:Transcript_59517/g.176534  ORF Transcript_59517/g.176534 Transcript_59517/m.176534 type:complete len:394 (+) Transcript_59517:1-1182(+)
MATRARGSRMPARTSSRSASDAPREIWPLAYAEDGYDEYDEPIAGTSGRSGAPEPPTLEEAYSWLLNKDEWTTRPVLPTKAFGRASNGSSERKQEISSSERRIEMLRARRQTALDGVNERLRIICDKAAEESKAGSSRALSDKESGDLYVHVARSMRGDYYHSRGSCHGLRTASGTTQILREGARLRGMRPCQLCSRSYVEDERHDGRSVISALTKISARGGIQDEMRLTRADDEASNRVRVYVAASLKGQCYHSIRSCDGLAKARGITSLSSDSAATMGMRPCRVCRPSSISAPAPARSSHYLLGSRDGKSLHITDSLAVESYGGRTSGDGSGTFRSSAPLVVANRSAGSFWVTLTGKCYHSRRSCSSLQRSRSVMQHGSVPQGKRPCSLCC